MRIIRKDKWKLAIMMYAELNDIVMTSDVKMDLQFLLDPFGHLWKAMPKDRILHSATLSTQLSGRRNICFTSTCNIKTKFFFPPSLGSYFIKMTSPKSGTRIFFLKTTQIYSINENSNSQQNPFLLVTEACRHSLPNQLPTDRHMLGDLQGSHSAPTPVLEVPDLIPRYFLLWVEVLLILLLVLVFNRTSFVQRKSG